MTTQVFINLPVKDPDAARAFFARLGYAHNPQFTDHNATCVVISDVIHVMLLARPFFATFTDKPVADACATAAAITALSQPDRAAVDALMERALAAGAREHRPADDHGFMYQRSFEDPDGHLWEVFHMDPAAVPGG